MQAGFLTDVFLPILMILGMLGLGISLTLADFRQIFVQPKAILVGLLNQLLLVPLTGILLAWVLPLSPELAAGLIIMAAAPGGVGSNLTTYLLGGDNALSVSLTTLSNLLAFITLPLWTGLGLYLITGSPELVSVSPAQIIIPVAVLTLIPIGLGLMIRLRWPQLNQPLKRPLRIGLTLLLMVAIVGTLVSQRENLLYYLIQAGAAVLILALATILLAFMTSWLFKLDLRTTITLVNESAVQNIPLTLTFSVTILANPLIAIMPAAYGLIQLFFFTIVLVMAFSPWASPLLRQQTIKEA